MVDKVYNYGYKYLSSGGCAKIFSDGKTILKCYYENLGSIYRIDCSLFCILRDIINDNFIELYESCPIDSFVETLKYNLGLPYLVGAYTAKFYKEGNIDILKCNKDYLLDNLFRIEKLFYEFALQQITVYDLKRDNVILTNNNIVIIDPDMFYISNEDKECVREVNRRELIVLLRSIIANAFNLKEMDDISKINKMIDEKLIGDCINSDKEVTYEVAKKLRYVKTLDEIFDRK